MPWDMYGHEPGTDAGHFTLHKFGNLIVHAGNGKSGEGVVENFTGTNFARNVIGIRRGTEAVLQFAPARKTFDPFWLTRGIDRIGLGGALIADQVGGVLDYVAFDATLSWTDRADAVERELVYLRGPTNAEYVVVLDRIALRNQADVPIWKVWTAAPSDFSAGVQTGGQAGIWEASGRPVARVVNQRSGLKTPYFESPDTHGALFVTPVWPSRLRMRILGGTNREFQDLNGATPFGTPAMTDGAQEYLGWGRIETWPLDRTDRHVFLHVLQPGDARTIGTPTTATPLASTDGAWLARLWRVQQPWILMWMDCGGSPVLPCATVNRLGHALARDSTATQPVGPIVAGEVIIGGTLARKCRCRPRVCSLLGQSAEPPLTKSGRNY
jgi:hypothetical protein